MRSTYVKIARNVQRFQQTICAYEINNYVLMSFTCLHVNKTPRQIHVLSIFAIQNLSVRAASTLKKYSQGLLQCYFQVKFPAQSLSLFIFSSFPSAVVEKFVLSIR